MIPSEKASDMAETYALILSEKKAPNMMTTFTFGGPDSGFSAFFRDPKKLIVAKRYSFALGLLFCFL